MRSWTASAALALVASTATASLTHIGNITLFSDTTCSDPVFINSWGLGRDFCAKVDNSASSPVDVPFRSYILNERPWCDTGSMPYLNVYHDETCAELIRSSSYDPGGPDADGRCVAPGGNYRAMAFVCDGFDGAWGRQDVSTVVSSEEAEASTTETSDVATLDSTAASAMSSSSIAVMSPASSRPSASVEIQATTAATITASATNGTGTAPSATTPAPTSAFTGAGSNLGIHAAAAVFGLAFVVLLA
ncbi:hypothetical protein PMIN04_006537 [Paraphaeosphaeria minitans]